MSHSPPSARAERESLPRLRVSSWIPLYSPLLPFTALARFPHGAVLRYPACALQVKKGLNLGVTRKKSLPTGTIGGEFYSEFSGVLGASRLSCAVAAAVPWAMFRPQIKSGLDDGFGSARHATPEEREGGQRFPGASCLP